MGLESPSYALGRRQRARIDASNEQYLQTLPLHERDQVEEAAKTWRGTARELYCSWLRWLRR